MSAQLIMRVLNRFLVCFEVLHADCGLGNVHTQRARGERSRFRDGHKGP